nr:uncharacterized protein C16orf78 homolog isoform X2 [Pogona vitticeps]
MAERNWNPLSSRGSMDWLDNKRAKALRVSNDREAFQLKKIRRSLDSMKIMNENIRKQEERKMKKWFRKQSWASPSSSYKSLQYKSSSYPEPSQDQNTETRPMSGKESIDMPCSQFGDHLSNFVSFLRLPTKRIIYDRKPSKDRTPFSGMDFPTQTISARNASAPRNSIYNNLPPNRESRKGSGPRQLNVDNSISLQEAVALFPSLQRLSTRGDRYLRLSQSNIDTLLELCKESGIYIDLHPHMKESDIDVSTVLSSTTTRSL